MRKEAELAEKTYQEMSQDQVEALEEYIDEHLEFRVRQMIVETLQLSFYKPCTNIEKSQMRSRIDFHWDDPEPGLPYLHLLVAPSFDKFGGDESGQKNYFWFEIKSEQMDDVITQLSVAFHEAGLPKDEKVIKETIENVLVQYTAPYKAYRPLKVRS